MEKFLSVKEIVGYISSDKNKALDVASYFAGKVKEIDPAVGAVLHFDEIKYRVSLDKAATDGKYYGLPVGVKDNISTDGWETTCASNILTGYIPPYDATVIEKIYENGGYVFTKCDMDEFAFGSSSETSAYNGRAFKQKKFKDGPVANPVNTEYVPGGSSGGSAAAVAAGEVPVALGSDTGGSIRQPASFCGVVGLKPTYGRVSRYGLIPFGSSLDQIGPITKSVEDAAVMLEIIAGYDEKDSTSVNIPVPDYTDCLGRGLKGMKIGVPKEYFSDGISNDVVDRVKEAVEIFKKLGVEVLEISLPHTKYAVPIYYVIATAEASSNLARFDGVQYGYRSGDKSLSDMYFNTREAGFGKEAKRRILLGTFVLSSGYYDAYYKRAQKARTLIIKDFKEAFKVCDIILTPTSPTLSFKFGEKENDPIAMYLSDVFTIPANLAGIPAISVPAGLSKDGLPVGVQIMAPHFKEEVIFQTAYAFETELKKR